MEGDSTRRQAFGFSNFNLKAEALILAALGLPGLACEATKSRKRSSCSTRWPILSRRPGPTSVLSNNVEN
jgi:hypothetical protein